MTWTKFKEAFTMTALSAMVGLLWNILVSIQELKMKEAGRIEREKSTELRLQGVEKTTQDHTMWIARIDALIKPEELRTKWAKRSNTY